MCYSSLTNEQKKSNSIYDGSSYRSNNDAGECLRRISRGGTKVLTETDLVDDKADVSIPVEYVVGATFSVRLPSSIELTNNAGSWDYTGNVGVKGDIDAGSSINVTPDSSITMYDVTNSPTDDVPESADDQTYDHKDAKDATVSQTKQQWGMTEVNANTYSDTDLTLTAGAMQSGKWKGTLNVDIEYKCYEKPGLYATDGTFTSWDELVSSELITVNNNKIKKCKTSVSGNLVVPEGITGIVSGSTSSSGAFSSCMNLTGISLPSSMTGIGDYAFSDCRGLTTVKIPESITYFGTGVFSGCAGLTDITLPEGITKVPHSMFNGCTGLTNITIPSTVKIIDKYAFSRCTSLTDITLPEGLLSIKDYAFNSCTGLTSITIPSSVTSIEDYAFSFCGGLTSITIPSSVTSIGKLVFYYCSNLTSATFNTTTGWYVGSSAGSKDTALSDTDLADSSTAATYLESTYLYKYWTRE